MRSLVGVCALLLALGAGSADADSGLRVMPFPGTPDASPSSEVIFSALRPSELRSVMVTGSRSGRHGGRLVVLPAGAGTAFVPKSPFASGEVVHVRAALSSGEAGTASGDPGAAYLRFSFGVGEAARVTPAGGLDEGLPWSQSADMGYGPTQQFRSAPDLRPPLISPFSNADRKSGDIFLAAQGSPQVGPMILDAEGHLVWFHPLSNGSSTYFATNLEVQHYQGHPVLTWWQGEELGLTKDVIMSRSYRTIATVRAGDGHQADLHEFQITPQGTALMSILDFTQTNLMSVGGPRRGSVQTSDIQEVDIKTGQVLWEWHALGHVPVDASYEPYRPGEEPYDYFHLNSIQQLPNGNLLISGRNTWALYEISRKTGRVLWTLGGKDSNFSLGPGTAFEWQHDARLGPSGFLSLFDDGSGGTGQSQRQSSAELLHVDSARRTVSLIHRFLHSPPLIADEGGSTQSLPDGDVVVGWGAQPVFSEYTPGGRQIFNASFPQGTGSYRALRFPWVGKPRTRPALAVSTGGRERLYASWNGATQVTGWRVLGGGETGKLAPLGITAPKTGFETTIRLAHGAPYLAVEALSSRGKVLGTSARVKG